VCATAQTNTKGWYHAVPVTASSSHHHHAYLCSSPQKISYELDALEAAAKGLPTLHTYDESVVTLKATLTSLYDAHLTITSGMKGAVAESTEAEVRDSR
jgi:hypothetical protein